MLKIPIWGWVSLIDRRRFRLFAYHTSAHHDGETGRVRRAFARFVQGPLALDRWCETIRADAPHVVIFPEIGMDQMTPRLAGLRLAPVQCTSWGHPTTSGLPTIDYFLSSELMEPPDADARYTEKLVRLPNLGIAYVPPHGQSIAGARALPPDAISGLIQPGNKIGTRILYDIPVPYNPEFGRGLNPQGFVLRDHAITTSQLGFDGVVPLGQRFMALQTE